MDLALRPARPDDAAFLAAMLAEAMAWRLGAPRPLSSTVLRSRYVVGWLRVGDCGVVAEVGRTDEVDETGRAVRSGERVGAAWYRLMAADDPGYGFIDAQTPEITVGVVPSWRGRGVGRRLLAALIAAAGADGHDALSLSVEEDNDARRLYESVGFRPVEKVGNAWTMVIHLQ